MHHNNYRPEIKRISLFSADVTPAGVSQRYITKENCCVENKNFIYFQNSAQDQSLGITPVETRKIYNNHAQFIFSSLIQTSSL